MNYNDYKEILEIEGLEESPLVEGDLIIASRITKMLRPIEEYFVGAKTERYLKHEQRKNEAIWRAIEKCRLFKDDPDMRAWVKHEYKRQNKTEWGGFH